MRTQYITLAANEVKTFESAGGYFEILGAANDLARIDWITEDGGFSDPWELVKEGVFGYLPFKGFRITNGPTAQTIKVLFGQGSGGNRAAPVSGSVGILGAVSADDPVIRAAALGETYRISGGAAGVAINTHQSLYLWNPVGSGVVAFVRRTLIEPEIAANADNWGFYKLQSYTTAPTGFLVKSIGVGSEVNVSKCLTAQKLGATSPLDEFGGEVVSHSSGFKCAAMLGERQDDLIALSPGEALVLWVKNGAVAAQNLNVGVDWIER